MANVFARCRLYETVCFTQKKEKRKKY